MLLAPGEAIFRDVPAEFLSPFPSEDAQASEKFQALQAAADADDVKLNESLAVRQQGRAFASALAILNKTKAVNVGDLLTDWLPRVAWFEAGKVGGDVVQGLFGEVPWGRLSSLAPDEVVKVMGGAGLNVAMSALSAVPVYGQVAAALVGAGKLMYRLYKEKNTEGVKLALPWSTYSRDTDEDLLKLLRDTVFRETDWTSIFAPPFDLEPWRVSLYGTEKKPKGLILIPTKGKEAAWSSSGVGCMPGTFRVAGQIQGVPQKLPEAPLVRHIMRPKGITPREVPIFWRQELTACGDFLPSIAQLGAATWQQVQCSGNPDMYKIRVSALEKGWRDYFSNLWSTAQAQMIDAWKEIGGIVGTDPIQAANLVGQLVEPYLCHRLTPESPWQLGVPAGWRPFPLFHEKIFSAGPVYPDHRNACLFVEEAYPGPKEGEPYWPYGVRTLKEHKKLRAGGFQQYTTPATDFPPIGYKCTAYPPRELAGAEWGSPYEVFIKPQLDALAKRQRDCLASTLVCAYVRPVGYEGLATYAAFAGKAGEELRERCLDIREQLLKNDARFMVNLKDVHDIDPKFEKKLRDSGVSNSPGQMSAAQFNLKAAGGVVEAPEPAEAPPVGGGVAFGDLVGPDEGGSGGLIAGLLGGGLVLGGGLAALMNRGGGRRHGKIRR